MLYQVCLHNSFIGLSADSPKDFFPVSSCFPPTPWCSVTAFKPWTTFKWRLEVGFYWFLSHHHWAFLTCWLLYCGIPRNKLPLTLCCALSLFMRRLSSLTSPYCVAICCNNITPMRRQDNPYCLQHRTPSSRTLVLKCNLQELSCDSEQSLLLQPSPEFAPVSAHLLSGTSVPQIALKSQCIAGEALGFHLQYYFAFDCVTSVILQLPDKLLITNFMLYQVQPERVLRCF